ncbi:MAG: DUF4404 family protein [Cyanobacteria bacterium P01_A01_bin.116]
MSKEDINKSLEALHAEIGKLDTPDSAVKDKLLALIADVEAQMQNPDATEQAGAATQKLPALIEQFEADHPKVTDTLGRLLTTLSGMGI